MPLGYELTWALISVHVNRRAEILHYWSQWQDSHWIESGFLLKGLVQSQVSKWKTSPKERLYISMYLHLWSCLFGFSSDQIIPILIKSTNGLLCRTGTSIRFAAWMPGTDKDIDDVWEDTGLETEILQFICKLLSRHSCVSLFCLRWSTAAFENWHDLMNFGLSCYW